jgi:TRAP-type uncharacterized transport system substrate-binding protein
MQRWFPWLIVATLTAVAIGVGLFAFRSLSQPTVLSVAVGPRDGEDFRLVTELARWLATHHSAIHVHIVPQDSPTDAAAALSAGHVNLAVIRGDLPVPSVAKAVVLLHKKVFVLIALPGSRIEAVTDLKRRTLGLIGPPQSYEGFLATLFTHYAIPREAVKTIDLAVAEVPAALRGKRMDALLFAAPLTGPTMAAFNAVLVRNTKALPVFISIDDADAIANAAHVYAATEINKGAFRGVPALPAEDIDTLSFEYYLVAAASLSQRTVATLARLLLEARRGLLNELPSATLIAAASTEKDALVPAHPGAAAYFDSNEKTFMEEYGDWVYVGFLLVGLLTSTGLALVRFLHPPHPALTPALIAQLHELRGRVREATTDNQLREIEGGVDSIQRAVLAAVANKACEIAEATALSLAVNGLEQVIAERRRVLGRGDRL